MKLRWIALPLAAAVVLAVSACGLTYSRTQDDKTEQVAITTVRITGDGGDVAVRPGSAGQVKIHRTISYWGDNKPTGITYRIDGSTLYLDTNCGHRCGVDYDVRVPEGVTVTGEEGSGDVHLSGVSKVDIDVHSGDVSLTGATGPVHVTARSGDITAMDIRSATTDLETRSGDIKLELGAPGNVTAKASSGDVSVRVPSGTSYRVDATTSSGDTRVDVPTDPNGSYHLTLHAGSGDVMVSRR